MRVPVLFLIVVFFIVKNIYCSTINAGVDSPVKENNTFGIDLYRALRGEGNRFLSPYSISTVFAAAYAGARGNTEKEMAAVFHEKGTEAAAATGAVVGKTSIEERAVFRADHPFLFIIRDTVHGSILFIGRVVDPSAGK